MHFHRWEYWKDDDGEGPLHFVHCSTHHYKSFRNPGVGPGFDGTIGVDRRTCTICHKVQHFIYMGAWMFDHWRTMGTAVPEARVVIDSIEEPEPEEPKLSLQVQLMIAYYKVTGCQRGKHYWQYHPREGKDGKRRTYRACEACLRVEVFDPTLMFPEMQWQHIEP